MPRGARPRVYPPELVVAVAELYKSGLTQSEVAAELHVSQKVIWNVMLRHAIQARPSVKRDQTGQNNDSWKGSRATYAAFHKRVEQQRGRPAYCEECKRSGPGRRYEWANQTGRYEDASDYRRLCVSCHRILDVGRRRKGVMPPCPSRRAK